MTTDQPTPSQRAGLRDEITKAIREAGPSLVGEIDKRDVHELADAVLTVLYRSWPWLRAEAEEARLHDPVPAAVAQSAPAETALRDRIAEALMAWAERNNSPKYAAARRSETVVANAYSRADAVLPLLPASAEEHRLALSDALGLGTGAPWDAIHDRVAELTLPPLGQDPVARRLGLVAEHRATVLNEAARTIAADAALRETEGEYALAEYGYELARLIRPKGLATVPAVAPGGAGEEPADETHEAEAQQGVARQCVEYFLQSRETGGVWEGSSSFMVELDYAAERLAKRRNLVPGFEYRIAQRTTTVDVRPLPDCLDCRHWMCNGDGPCGALVDSWQRCTCPGPSTAVSQPGKEH